MLLLFWNEPDVNVHRYGNRVHYAIAISGDGAAEHRSSLRSTETRYRQVPEEPETIHYRHGIE